MPHKRVRLWSAVMLLLVLFCDTGGAQTRLPAIFSDHMVLQQKMRIPLWGSAPPGATVTVQLGRQRQTARVDARGQWRVHLHPMPAGGPYELLVWSSDTLRFRNVMIGEVWLCSGQSNMEMPLVSTWAKVNNFREEVAAANHPNLRLLLIKRAKSTKPQSEADTEGWKVCDTTSVKNFSATAYFFGRHLQQKLGVPVGLIQSAWGGTVVEAWTSGASLKTVPDIKGFVELLEKTARDSIFDQALYEKNLQGWHHQIAELDRQAAGSDLPWWEPQREDQNWQVMELPTVWERAGLVDFDGLVWFRKHITLPETVAGRKLRLHLGPIDDFDWTFFNGREIGRTTVFNVPRQYEVPADLVQAGDNVIAVRVLDTGGNGGFYGRPEQLYLVGSDSVRVALAGAWRFQSGLRLREIPLPPPSPRTPNRPTVLYNAMIAPLIPYALRGVIWYQGESNAARAYQYRTLFPLLIRDWRRQWQQGDFPFLFVQLANYQAVNTEPVESEWAELREAQTLALAEPKTGMAVTIDIGDANDIHPGNKQGVGERLALQARRIAYGEKLVHSGPLYKGMKIENNRIRLFFDHTGSGLLAGGNQELRGFAIAGADRKFVWAHAQIAGKTVVVSHPQVPQPVAVRYAWAGNPVCNLFNREGLPASPFRTDDWPGVTRETHLNRQY
ncbi:MAG: 9-O-acetylesterase [candidate division KSB1 bacterium]|nr:9-O-acetylesterase [candidate division KSB1 bacterium]MDZ7276312.1 9-O-acetylesterase [candidate division KSB1 bacterium]MDZ7287735.1 9-O-acetylesterase [candidate division KSB1 bacterium]MDZ7299925.1 9-O-acetylesterase [candidate division KSB1 bacterium]MDZ7305746.1 9-O-acetylesterase [candidate division KSB1 bacterium]